MAHGRQLQLANEALLQYEERDGGILELWHTEVPISQRGKGLGAVLCKVRSCMQLPRRRWADVHMAVQAAFEYIETEGLRAIPSCTYIEHKYVATHPEVAKLCVNAQL